MNFLFLRCNYHIFFFLSSITFYDYDKSYKRNDNAKIIFFLLLPHKYRHIVYNLCNIVGIVNIKANMNASSKTSTNGNKITNK